MHKGLFGSCGEFFVPFSLPSFKASAEEVSFGPPSHVRARVSRVDFFRVVKRWGCRFLSILFSLLQMHPRALSDVTPSGLGHRVLRNVYDPICPV